MSIIFGVVNRTGMAVDPRVIEAMRAALGACARDAETSCVRGSAAFGCLATHDTSESVHERMPVWLPEQRLLFVARGRIDNRDELAAALGIAVDSRTPDGDVMLHAYRRWGSGAPARLLGDWSFAAFDGVNDALLVARDQHGYSALDYHVREDRIVFSSNIKALLALDDVPRRPDADTVVRTLIGWRGGTGAQSFYEGIHHLASAHVLTVDRTSHAARRYWFPERITVRRDGDARARAEEFRGVLERAIAARLRTRTTVASTLSGGLDSGTVSYLAAARLARSGATLPTLSHVPRHEPSRLVAGKRIGDERPNIEAVIAASGNMAALFLDSASTTPVDGIRQFLDIAEAPVHGAGNAYWRLDIARAAASRGFGAVLTGEMGNATISFRGVSYLLPARTLLATHGVRAVLRHKLRRRRPARFDRRKAVAGAYWPDAFVNVSMLERRGFLQQLEAAQHAPGVVPVYRDAREYAHAVLMIGSSPRGYYGSLLEDRFGVAWRDPTADVRVIEYALAIPNEMFFDARGNGSNMVRTMMRGMLPASVLFAGTKGLQSADIGLRALACSAQFEALLAELQRSHAAREFIDVAALGRGWEAITQVRDNRFDVRRVQSILRTAMTGLFLTRFG